MFPFAGIFHKAAVFTVSYRIEFLKNKTKLLRAEEYFSGRLLPFGAKPERWALPRYFFKVISNCFLVTAISLDWIKDL